LFGGSVRGLSGAIIEREEAISALLAPVLDSKGYSLVRVRIMSEGQSTLQVMVERSGGKAIELEDCADVSAVVSALLDAKDLMEGPYQLEISSPGIDRPLMNAEDFKRYMGYDASIIWNAIRKHRPKLKGRIVGVANEAVKIQAEGNKKIISVRFADICDAKLVLTDSLIKAAADMDR
tara:strand:- start:2268 stop:2801 length:534 start_codon:yes stop_codon:yes gene_type:complete